MSFLVLLVGKRIEAENPILTKEMHEMMEDDQFLRRQQSLNWIRKMLEKQVNSLQMMMMEVEENLMTCLSRETCFPLIDV